MAYATVMRVAPVMRGAVKGLTAHNARTEAYAKKTIHIDPARVKNNRILIGTADPSRDITDAIEGVAMARRSHKSGEEYIGAEVILSANAKYFERLESSGLAQWIDLSVTWLKKQEAQGRGKLVNAILHMDEGAPHIHGIFAPIVQRSRIHPVTKQSMPAKVVLNYSALYGDRPEVLANARREGRSHLDTQLGRLQTSYADAMAPCGLVRGRKSMRTKEPDMEHIAPRRYRAVKSQIDTLEKQRDLLENSCKTLEKKMQDAEEQAKLWEAHAVEWKRYQGELEQECDRLEIVQVEAKSLGKILTDQLKQLQEKYEHLKEKYNHGTIQVLELKQQCSLLIHERETISSDILKTKHESNAVLEYKADAENQCATVQSALKNAEEQLTLLNNNASVIRENLSAQEERLETLERTQPIRAYDALRYICEAEARTRPNNAAHTDLQKLADAILISKLRRIPKEVQRLIARSAGPERERRIMKLLYPPREPAIAPHSASSYRGPSCSMPQGLGL